MQQKERKTKEIVKEMKADSEVKYKYKTKNKKSMKVRNK
jgi:hypothetical protein